MGTLIGIAGGSASGKSTLTEALARRLTGEGLVVSTICTDRYGRQGGVDAPTFVASTGQVMFDKNHPDTIDNDRLVDDIRSTTVDVLIVEGLMVLHVDRLR